MNILHLLISGGFGGIEKLCKDIALNSVDNNILCFLWEGGPLAEEAKKQGAKVYILNQSRYRIIHTHCLLKKICREEKIQVVNLQHGGPYVDIQFMWIKKACQELKIVTTEHCYADYYLTQTENKLKEMLWTYSYRLKFLKADAVIAVSEGVRQSYIQRFSIPEDKIKRVYNGIDQSFFLHGKQKSYPCCEVSKLLYIGRLDEYKGVDLLLEALRKIKGNYELTLVGDGNCRSKLEEMVKEYGMEEKVHFEGYQMQIDDYLQNADIFIYPTKCEEAFGLSVVEAMAYGLPCVVTPMGGLKEIVENGKNGIIATECSVAALKKAVCQMLEICRSEEGNKYSRQALLTSKKFSIANTISGLHEVYNNCITSNSRGKES